MAYQTGTASSPSNLLQTLATWLQGRGWTLNENNSEGSGWVTHASRGGIFVNIRAAVNETVWAQGGAGTSLSMYLSTAYSGAAAWNAQAGAPTASGSVVGVSARVPSGSITAYHFFDDGADHIAVVIERTPGVFAHLMWGPSLTKAGAYTDGQYFAGSTAHFWHGASAPSGQPGVDLTADHPFSYTFNGGGVWPAQGFVRVSTGLFAENWCSTTDQTSASSGGTGRRLSNPIFKTSGPAYSDAHMNYRLMQDRAVSQMNQQANLLPLHLCVLDNDLGWRPLGYPPRVFYTSAVGLGFAQGAVLQIGGLDYMIFPNFAVRRVP